MYPVQVVSRVPKTRRENGGSSQRNTSSPKTNAFAAVLEKAVRQEHPMNCCVVTYNASRELQTFSYGYSREYTA